MRSVLMLSAIGSGIVLLFSCAVGPVPEPAPQAPAPPPKVEPMMAPSAHVAAAPYIWELVVPAGSGGPSRQVLTAAQVDSLVRSGRLDPDGPAVQFYETGRYTRAGPRQYIYVRSPAPLAAGSR